MRYTTRHRFNRILRSLQEAEYFLVTFEESPKIGFYWHFMGESHGPFKSAEAARIDAVDR